MPYVQYTSDELAINAAALVLRQHASQFSPATYGWGDAYTYTSTRSGQWGIGIKPNARAIAPPLPEWISGTNALCAWTMGIQGTRLVATPGPETSAIAPAETWQQRILREVAEQQAAR